MDNDLLVVEIEERRFGIPADLVREVVRAVRPMPLPRRPKSTLGIINLRGDLIPVLDTRGLLDLSKREVDYSDHFVIVLQENLLCALHVDRAVDLSPQLPASEKEKMQAETNPSGQSLLANTRYGYVQRLTVNDLLSTQQLKSLRRVALVSSSDQVDGDERTAR